MQKEQTSKPFLITQHVKNPHDGCLSLKLIPPQPGQAESPFVWNRGHNAQSIPQDPIVLNIFKVSVINVDSLEFVKLSGFRFVKSYSFYD